MTKISFVLKKFKRYQSMYLEYLALKRNISKTSLNIYLFGCPFHSNMGDQAQTFCIINWAKQNYPNHHIHTFYLRNSTSRIIKFIRKNIHKDDKIFCHSGYHLTNLYDEQRVYCQVVEMFPDFPIVIFPQTVNYTDTTIAQKTAELFNSHKNMTILCRDEISFASAKTLFNKCNLLLYPDVVTSLIGTKQFENQRSGILFCIRNDKEAHYKPEQIKGLKIKVGKLDSVTTTDTTIKMNPQEIINDRGKVLEEIFDEYSRYRLIITDRYHGTIFSLIAGTPVIVLSSSDHKLSSGVKWFPPEFNDYVKYANNLEEALLFVESMLQKNYENKLPDYFKQNYWNVLKQKIAL